MKGLAPVRVTSRLRQSLGEVLERPPFKLTENSWHDQQWAAGESAIPPLARDPGWVVAAAIRDWPCSCVMSFAILYTLVRWTSRRGQRSWDGILTAG
jgi:hypothetical protein